MHRYFQIENLPSLNDLLLNELEAPTFVLSNGEEDYLIGFGVDHYFVRKASEEDTFQNAFDSFIEKTKGRFRLGYLGYDLKNDVEPMLFSRNKDGQQALYSYFMVPKHVFIKKSRGSYYFGSEKTSLSELLHERGNTDSNPRIDLETAIKKEDYIENVNRIKKEIQEGKVYEMNYCVNFAAKTELPSPQKLYQKLVANTNAPFSAYLNLKYQQVLCASPERFLNKTGNQLISQPIKGTAKRGASAAEDEQLITELRNSKKEIAENVMIVDLVRNDLSKVAQKNSVKVQALNEVKTFESVHQLVSTVGCETNASVGKIVEATFPMGSMTGAPKISAMQFSEQFEMFRRGIYSGAIGLIQPNEDFDFNVVIRSLIYNKKQKILSAPVGGAITIQSDPEMEYEECLTKLKSTQDTLTTA